jgi:hypothetical protein
MKSNASHLTNLPNLDFFFLVRFLFLGEGHTHVSKEKWKPQVSSSGTVETRREAACCSAGLRAIAISRRGSFDSACRDQKKIVEKAVENNHEPAWQ